MYICIYNKSVYTICIYTYTGIYINIKQIYIYIYIKIVANTHDDYIESSTIERRL